MEKVINDPSLVQPLAGSGQGDKKSLFFVVGVAAGLVLAGIFTGRALYQSGNKGINIGGKAVEVVNTPTEEGFKDTSTFKDTATGTIQANDGKITNEGSHVLIRGNVSQNVYLTSSVVDMDKYIGKKVQVWGETFQGRKAGWLMDVGRIKIEP